MKEANRSSARGREQQLLIIDDNASDQEQLGAILSSAGYPYREASSPEQALTSLQTMRPSLILLALNQPGTANLELCRQLRDSPTTSLIPVILLIDHAHEQAKVAGYAAGADDYISKPFLASEVLGRVRTHLSLFQLQNSLQERDAQLLAAGDQRKRAEAKQRRAKMNLESLWTLAKRQEDSLPRLSDFIVEEITRITLSRYAFYGFMDLEASAMIIQAWSRETMQECAVDRTPILFPIGDAGLWADAVRSRRPVMINNYPDQFAGKRGLPAGHFPLTRVIAMPVLHQGRVVAVAGVANKEAPYDEEDLQQLGLFLDNAQIIIKHKQTEEKTRQSEERFRTIFNQAPIGVALIDSLSGRILEVNPRYAEITGRSREELAATDWAGITHPDDVPTDIDKMARMNAGETAGFQEEKRYLRPGGEVVWVNLTVVPVMHSGKRLNRHLSMIEDITGRKRKQAEIEQKNAELERFIYTVSHDLKTPLVTIQGFAGSLEEDLGEDPGTAIKEDLAYIRNAASKMHALLQDLLELTRLGHIVSPAEVVDMETLLQEVLPSLQELLSERPIDLRIKRPLPQVIADRRRLHEVLQNLLENAVKFLGEQTNPVIELGMAETGRGWAFYVRDNGCGIAPDYQEKVFVIFERLNAEMDGTGIGLALVKRIIELHEGEVWIESAGEGLGTTVWFTLPWQTPPT